MAPIERKKRCAVKQEDEDAESRKTPRVNSGEEASAETETGGNVPVPDLVAAPPVVASDYMRLQVKMLLDCSREKDRRPPRLEAFLGRELWSTRRLQIDGYL
jgi:hypothetical protein